MPVPQLELEKNPPLSVEEFLELAQRQGWDEDTRVELLDGEIVWMSPIGDPHAAFVSRLNELFRRYPTDVALIWPQNPVRVSQIDLPQPDLGLLRPRADYYGSAAPRPERRVGGYHGSNGPRPQGPHLRHGWGAGVLGDRPQFSHDLRSQPAGRRRICGASGLANWRSA
jgi:hypothetical protein